MPTQLPPANVSTDGTALRVFEDTGAPSGSDDYTTLVMLHGLGWHSGNFKNLLPHARKFNTRIVLVNRRDYPGSFPLTPKEHARLSRLASSPTTTDVAQETSDVMADHGRNVYDFLVDFVRRERIPVAMSNSGGVVLVGWSLACVWITALLANVVSFPIGDVRLDAYVRRVALYDPSCVLLGYPRPSNCYNPATDPSIPPAELLARYNQWLSGYYTHGDLSKLGPDALETRRPAVEPSSTMSRLSAVQIGDSVYGPPMDVSGSDRLLIEACMTHGTWGVLKDDAFYLRDRTDVTETSDWRLAEVRVVWCDRSVWETPLAVHLLNEELRDAKNAGGKAVRDVSFVRVGGANHFAHWDMPDKVMKAFLGNDLAVE